MPALNSFVDQRDRDYVEREPDPQRREAIACTVAAWRRPDRLSVGDPVPDLVLARLDGGVDVRLGELRDRPRVLIFGSYT